MPKSSRKGCTGVTRSPATARDPGAVPGRALGGRLLTLPLDVTKAGQAAAAAQAAVRHFGRIDVLVNSAGCGLLGAVEETSDAAARAVFDTVVFGVLYVLRAVLPVMRRQRSGHVLTISPAGGFTRAPGWGVYGASKSAVEGLPEALSQEVGPLGIKVTVIEPGAFRSDFLDESSLRTEPEVIGDYDATAGSGRACAVKRNHEQPGDPAKAAAVIVGLTTVPDPPRRIQLGSDAVAEAQARLDRAQAELDTWRHVSRLTDYDSFPHGG